MAAPVAAPRRAEVSFSCEASGRASSSAALPGATVAVDEGSRTLIRIGRGAPGHAVERGGDALAAPSGAPTQPQSVHVLTLPLGTISAQHANIVAEWPFGAPEPVLQIEVLSKTNGVWVNDERVPASGARLMSGDTVTLTRDTREGPVRYRVELRSVSGRARTRASTRARGEVMPDPAAIASSSLAYSLPPSLAGASLGGSEDADASDDADGADGDAPSSRRSRSRGVVVCDADPRDVYTVVNKLGEGGFAQVYRVKHKTTGREYAMKEIDISRTRTAAPKSSRASGVDPLEEEIRILSGIRHRHVVALHEVYKHPGGKHLYLVMELITGRELFDKVIQKQKIPEVTARGMFRQIFSAVAYLHSQGVVHRDLKPENILLQPMRIESHSDGGSSPVKKYLVKITDFGMSRLLSRSDMAAASLLRQPGSSAAQKALAAASRAMHETPMSLDDLDADGRVVEGGGARSRKRRAMAGDPSSVSMEPHSQVVDTMHGTTEELATLLDDTSTSAAARTGALDRMSTVVGTQLYLAPEIRMLYSHLSAADAREQVRLHIQHAQAREQRAKALGAASTPHAGARRSRDEAAAPPSSSGGALPSGYHYLPDDEDWRALEAAVTDGYDASVDSWSLGVIMYVCLYGLMPFFKDEGDRRPSILVQMLTQYMDLRAAPGAKVSEAAQEVLRGLLHPNPKKRLSPAAALRHRWFAA